MPSKISVLLGEHMDNRASIHEARKLKVILFHCSLRLAINRPPLILSSNLDRIASPPQTCLKFLTVELLPDMQNRVAGRQALRQVAPLVPGKRIQGRLLTTLHAVRIGTHPLRGTFVANTCHWQLLLA